MNRSLSLIVWPVLSCLALTTLHAPASVHPDRWRWSNPLPHGNNVLDMLLSKDLAVQAGDAGSLYVQMDGGRWTPAVTSVDNYLRGVALMGDRFLAVGEDGCILWSDDGQVFQRAQLSPPTANWFEGVAATAARAVAVGDNGCIYTSTNGIVWLPSNSGTDEWLRGVTAGNGIFVAVGEFGTVLRSTAGTSWNRISSFTYAHLNRVRYLGGSGSGQFVAVGNGGVAFSSVSGSLGWTSLNSGTTNNLYDVALNDRGTLLVGDQEVRFRPAGSTAWIDQVSDLPTNAAPAWVYICARGLTNRFLMTGRTGLLVEGTYDSGASAYAWQPLPDSSHAWLWDVTVQNGTYIAAGDLATIQTSLDGILWASEAVPVPVTNTVLLGVGGTTNLLLAAGNDGMVLFSQAGWTNLTVTNLVGTNVVVTNLTVNTWGLLWTNLPPFTTNTLQGVAAHGDLYVLSGALGQIYTSTNGFDWNLQSTPTTRFLSGVAAFPGGWVAVGDRGTLLRAGPDATDWNLLTTGTTNWLYRVRWVGDQLVAVGQNGALYSSPDGSNWTAQASGTTRWINDVTFAGDTWFATGTQGLLLSSSNLSDWSSLRLPTIKSLFGATSWDGQLILAGIEGVILRNQVVPKTTPVSILGYHRSVATNTVQTTTETNAVPVAYELFLFGGEPDQFFEFQSCTNMNQDAWCNHATLEMFDASGTLYLLRDRDLTNAPPEEFYRTWLVP